MSVTPKVTPGTTVALFFVIFVVSDGVFVVVAEYSEEVTVPDSEHATKKTTNSERRIFCILALRRLGLFNKKIDFLV